MSDNICRICGCSEYYVYLNFREKKRHVVLCGRCKTLRTIPYFLMDYSEQELYCEHYIKNEKEFRGFAKTMMQIVFGHRKKGRLLDIGCAVGFMMEEAKSMGFDVEGVELNEKAQKIARSKGLKVKGEALDDSTYNEGAFDIVILNHVLEHIANPNAFLKNAVRILKKSGILIIGVPNYASMVACLYRARWYGWGVSEHVWHFDKKSLGSLLSRNGFRVREVIQNNQYYPFSKSFRKNLMALVALLADRVGAGDQLIAVAEKI